ncbi:MAG: hypothetical protein LOY01_13305, partial [Brachybacterium paraconglomeratum]|nr:hypothetical protein [Brachybacterium paraconglomeratum]
MNDGRQQHGAGRGGKPPRGGGKGPRGAGAGGGTPGARPTRRVRPTREREEGGSEPEFAPAFLT